MSENNHHSKDVTAPSCVTTIENSTSTFNSQSTSQITTTAAENITTEKRQSTLTRVIKPSSKNDGVANDTNAIMPNSTTTLISNAIYYAKRKMNEKDIKYTTDYKPKTQFVPSVFPRTISYPFHNNYQMSLDIQKEADNKYNNLVSVQLKPPTGFNDYLMNKRTYRLADNCYGQVANAQIPPTNLHKQLKMLFIEQEEERQKLRKQHLVQKEKLALCIEQEVLRVHGQIARVLVNQPVPLSICTYLKDRDVCSLPYKNNIDKNEQPHYNHQQFLSWLQDIDDKWEKNKKSMLLRQRNEAESLHAVQKMDWGWKLKELSQSLTFTSEPNTDEDHVPIVLVVDNFSST